MMGGNGTAASHKALYMCYLKPKGYVRARAGILLKVYLYMRKFLTYVRFHLCI